jgi:DnaJ-class molecular chaperone
MFFGGSPFNQGPPPDTNEFYNDLGISKDATQSDIKKAYRKLALQHHPDKGGDQEKFKTITSAYEVLSDPEKRERYNKFGKDAFKEGGISANPEDVFSMFFNNDRHSMHTRGPSKAKDIVHEIKVSLNVLYNGKKLKVTIKRMRTCKDCYGSGCKTGKQERTCTNCNGRGIKTQLHQIGPGMIQQSQTTCCACSGKGKIINPADACNKCKGKKLLNENHAVIVPITKSMKSGQQIRFPNEGNEAPDQITSDIIFIIKETPDSIYKRHSNDLVIEKSIKLGDALCGVKFSIKTLDNRTIVISSKPNQVIKPSSIMMVANEGMPINNNQNQNQKGNLYIQFTVEFPNEINNNKKHKLKDLLPNSPYQAPNNQSKLQEYKLESTNKTKFNTQSSRQHNRGSHQSHNGQQVECQNCIM